MPRTLAVQNQIRSTTSGVEYDDTLTLALAEDLVNESFLTDPTQVSGTLVMDMNFVRTALRDLKGDTPDFNWFDPAASTTGLITLSGARLALSSLETFVGSTGDEDQTPGYSSTIFITQNADLETTISELDLALSSVSGSAAGEIQKRKLIRTGGQLPADTTVDLSSPDAGWTVDGDNIVYTSAGNFVEDVSVFHNGILQLPGSGSGDDNDVYFVATPDELAFEYIIKTNDIVQVWKFPPSS